MQSSALPPVTVTGCPPCAIPVAGITVRPVPIAALLESKALIAEYAAECSIPLVGEIDPQPGLYDALERAGVLKCFAAFDGYEMVGFATFITVVLPHYGKKVATVESLFVASANRKGIAGTELRNAIKDCAREAGCVAVFYSAPSGGHLEKLLEGKKNCHRTNAIFCESLQ